MEFTRLKGAYRSRPSSFSILPIAKVIFRRPREDFEILKVFHPSNLPGKSMIVASVSLDPNGATPSHTHGGAAIVAFPVDGTLLNQMNQDEPLISKPGDSGTRRLAATTSGRKTAARRNGLSLWWYWLLTTRRLKTDFTIYLSWTSRRKRVRPKAVV
jgi:hypothetical protein